MKKKKREEKQLRSNSVFIRILDRHLKKRGKRKKNSVKKLITILSNQNT